MDPLYDHRSKYQQIQVYGNELGRALLLDGTIQLTTGDTHRYHEAMAIVPYLFSQFANRVLILGGGDGYAAKTLLDTFPISKMEIVDIDPEVIEVSRAFFDFPNDKRLRVHYKDAWEFIKRNLSDFKAKWDLILADYTDPSSPHAARLYTMEHFREIFQCLSRNGVFCTQMVSPFANPKAASCLIATMTKAFKGKYITPYRVYLPFHPPPGQQGFCMASSLPMQLQVPRGLRYLNSLNINSIFWLDGDESYVEMPESTEDNLLYSQLYKMTYDSGVKEWKEEY